MYVREMHIEVNQSMQKIAANRTRKLLDDEVDWLLNKNQERFVWSRVTPKSDGSGGFELKQFGIDAIRMLVKRGVEVPAYIADPRSYVAYLPGDYSYLLSDESVIKRAPVDLANTPLLAPASTLTRNLLLLPVSQSLLSSGPWYGQLQVYLNNGLVFDIQQYTQARNVSFTGFNSKAQVYEISNLLLCELASQRWNVYWENYGTINYPRMLIIDTGPVVMTGSIIIDGTAIPGLQRTVAVQAADYPTLPTEDQANRLTASHVVQNLREVAFYRTQPESPISELSGAQLFTYASKYFIVTNNRLSYVRKPRRISLVLGQDCELAPETHQMICDLTVEYAKAMIADPNWKVKLQDDMQRTPV